MKTLEDNELLAANQFGFRRGYCCADAIMVTTTVIEKARLLGLDSVKLVFADIKAAYDTTSRRSLFESMNRLGLGGPIVKLVKSFYAADNVRIEIGGKRSRRLYLCDGLKQGCSTSPTSFNIVMSSIAERMNNSNSLIRCGNTGFGCLVYADDVLIISPSDSEMRNSIDLLEELCGEVGLKISLEKSKIVSTVIEKYDTGRGKLTLESVLSQRYLGVILEIGVQYTFLESKVNTAMKFVGSCMSLAKSSPSPFLFATVIWRQVAIPSITYGAEVIILSEAEIMEIEKQQNKLAKFILQLHHNSSGAVTQLLAGWKPFEVIYMEKVLKYYVKMREYPEGHWTKMAFRENLKMKGESDYVKKVGKMIEKIQWDGKKETLDETLAEFTMKTVNANRLRCKSMRLLPKSTPGHLTHTSPLKDCDTQSKVYHEFITFNAGLGNRHPIPNYRRTIYCVLCENDNISCKLNEGHVLFSCEAMKPARMKVGIADFMQEPENNEARIECLYKKYWTSTIDYDLLKERIQAARVMQETYIEVAKTIMDDE